jgi:hypothetical protein
MCIPSTNSADSWVKGGSPSESRARPEGLFAARAGPLIRTVREPELAGAVVLDDTDDLEEGAPVRAWVGDPESPVEVSEEELSLVRKGQAAAERGELLDARGFLRELRRED